MAEGIQENTAKAVMPLLIFPLFLSLLTMTQLVNVTHVEGLADDFSGMVLEAVTASSTYDVPYEVLEKQDGEWILVNATLPEENYTLNVLSSSSSESNPGESGLSEPYITDVTFQDGLLPDFSNLIVSYESAGGPPAEIPHSFIAVEPGSWATLALERAPEPDESIIFAAHLEEPANPSGNETGSDVTTPEPVIPETPETPESNETSPEPPQEPVLPDDGNETGFSENGTSMNETQAAGLPEPEPALNETTDGILNETDDGIYVSDDSENSTLLIPGNYTIEAINETNETIGLYANLDSLVNLTNETLGNETQGLDATGGFVPPEFPASWGKPTSQKFQVRGSKGRSFDADISISRNGAEVSFGIGKGMPGFGVPGGKFDIAIKPDKNKSGSKEERPFAPIEEVRLKDVDLSSGDGFDLGLEYLSPNELPFGKSARQAFAIDPTMLSFTSGEVSVRAKGSELYKCAEWDFEGQLCTGSWEWQADIVPGEIYTISIGPDDPAWAEYNTTYGAPRCGNSSSPCYANSSLLQSRDSLVTPEPNQPNTLDSCADGSSGIYWMDESVENITVTDLNGTTFNAGDTVSVTATVYCFDATSDNINFLYTSSASSPSWTTVGYTDPCPLIGVNTITKTFVLDSVPGEHAVRVTIQFLGDTATTCGAGSYDDNDDVAFMVNGTDVPQPGDAVMAYRSNTGVFGVNSPKIRFWNASGAGAWGREIELQSAGSPVRFARAAWSPLSSKVVVVTQSDDGNLDGYVCMANCSRPGSWSYSSNIGAVLATTPPRRFDIAFETSTGDLILTYSVVSANTARDLAYKVLPSGTSSFSGLTEQYLDDSVHATNLVYSWVRMDSKPGNSQEIALVAFDVTDSDINSWIWNGSAWNNQTEISNAAASTAGYEALAIRYAADGSVAMVMGAEGANGTVDSKYWNGSAWSSAITFDVDGTDLNDVRWANLKADPASDDLQAVFTDNGADLTTAYWNGSTWSVTTGMDNAIDSAVARSADFEWNLTGSVGRLVWDTDGAGTTLSQRPCTPQCTGTTATSSAYAGTGAWVTMWRNPSSAGNVRILSARLNSFFDIGSYSFSSASAFSNYGDAAITSDTTVSTFESYSIAFNTSDATPPFINFTAPTPLNNTVIYVDNAYINVTVTDNTAVNTVTLEWNGTNQTINNTSGTSWEINKTGLVPGVYTYRVFANDSSGNLNVSETRRLVYGSRPSVIVLDPQGGTYDQSSYIPIAINATDSDNISKAIATITLPNSTQENITLVISPPGDNFNFNTIGIAWFIENWSISPSQTCVADINGTVPGKAFTSLYGDGSPYSDTYCSLVTTRPLYGDFDLNVSFDILASDGVDNAINFKLTEDRSSFSSKQAFLSLGNWTGEGRTYDVFVDDGSTSGYMLTRDTDDTAGKFRITRSGDNFTFYTWNNTDSSWTLENSSILNMSTVLFITMESESAFAGWGTMNVTWDNLTIIKSPYYIGSFNNTGQTGLYNIAFYVNDTLNAVNDSETANFTIAAINDPPTVPFILAPTIGQNVYGEFNITWSSVIEEENDTVQFNITLLNSDGSDNATIVADYGNASATNYPWDTSVYPDGEYSMRVTVYENETVDGLDNSYTLAGTFFINNAVPSVVVIAPLGGDYPDCLPVSISINASDSGGIDTAIATITLPDNTSVNITLDGGQTSDNFSVDSMGADWIDEATLVGPSQVCTVDIDTSVPGAAYTSLEGPDGLPLTTTLCSAISSQAIDGDFDISIDFSITGSSSIDHALNFQVLETQSSADATKLVFMTLSNWTGLGQNYEIYVNDGNITDYVMQRPTNDTSGRFRIVRQANNFTFYIWNNTASAWDLETVDFSEYNLSRALYVSFESESDYPGWGTMNVSWDNFNATYSNNTFAMFTDTCQIGLYNVSFYVNDTLGSVNDTEKTNFTIVDINNPPSSPYILAPANGDIISGQFNITGTQVFDQENDSLRMNITLLNPDYTFNSTIASDVGNATATFYEWDTTTVPDGVYSLEVVFYENETVEGLSSSDTLQGNFTVDNNPPYLQFEPPTETSGSTASGRDYILVNVSAIDITLNEIQIFLYNSSGDQIDSFVSGSSPAFANFTGLPEGLYYFNATAYDLAGFENSTETWNVTLTYLAIDGEAARPDPQGFGWNVTILANVSNASAVLLGITPPGGNETNYTMANLSAILYEYNFTGWVNGTYLYTIYANNSAGSWFNGSENNFTLFQNISIQARTIEDFYMANETINLTDPEQINEDAPKIRNTIFGDENGMMQARDSPVASRAAISYAPGEGIPISAHVIDKLGVRNVSAIIPTMGGDETVQLSLSSGTAVNGIWRALWTPHDIIGEHYIVRITAENTLHINQSSYVSVGDPPGLWILPNGHEDPSGLWSNDFNVRDGDTHTYAEDNSNPGSGWGEFIIFNTTQIQSDRVRVWADYGAQVGSVQVDVFDGSKWVNAHNGSITNLAWNELSFNTTNITAGRFRYNYTVGGWIYWLYEFQFYNVTTFVNPPVISTGAATSVEESAAILHGTVLSDGGDMCQVRFLYGNDTSYSNSTPWFSDKYTGNTIGYRIAGLENGMTYHFIAQINNSANMTNGSSQSFTAGPAATGWASATGFDDPDGRWLEEGNMYDDDLVSEAHSFHDVNDVDGVWSSYLYVNRSPELQTRRIRFNAKSTDIDLAEVEVYSNGTWTTVYNSTFIDSIWTDAIFNLSNVSQARIRFRAIANNRGFEYRLAEFDFYKSPVTAFENQSRLDNWGPTNASCYLFMKTQFWNGTDWQDDDVVVNETTPRMLEPSDVLKLDLIWNPNNYSTNNLSFGTGVYRVYSACHDNESNVLMDFNGTLVNSTFNFTYDTTNPEVIIVSPANGTNYTLTSTIPIRINVTEDFYVATVLANVSTAIGYEIVTLAFNSTSGLWEYDYLNTNYVGIYTIRAIANDTSGNVNDTEFVQVNVIDISAPSVVLISPPDGYANSTSPLNVTFTCNVTDNYDTDNISLFITDRFGHNFSYNGTTPVSGVYTTASFTLDLPQGTYAWNCLAYDSSNNSAWAPANWSLTIGPPNCPIINSSGVFNQSGNYLDAPNPAAPLGGYACVVIASSDVVFDCNGYNITGIGVAPPTYGVLVNGSYSNITLRNCPGISNYTYGIDAFQPTGFTVSNSSAFNNTYGFYSNGTGGANATGSSFSNNTYGVWLEGSANASLGSNSIADNTGTGIHVDANSTNASLVSNTICGNGFDLDSQGGNGTGSLDRCDSFMGWSENNHFGCEYSCSSMWHRFFGNANGTIVLTDNPGAGMVYSWNATAMNVYFADFDSAIDWQALAAIGQTTANASASNDFIELDTSFNTSSFDDNINATYSSDGSAPIETANYTVYGRPISLIPIANSTAFNTSFDTGILWDTSDGGTEYTNTINQSTVWMVAVNASSADTYGTYDFLVQVPDTLATYEGGNDVISVYVELK
jgi:hypothetical protein